MLKWIAIYDLLFYTGVYLKKFKFYFLNNSQGLHASKDCQLVAL